MLIGIDQGGINRYNYINKKFDYFTAQNPGFGNLTSDGVYCFHKDFEDILWVGTSRGGINYSNPQKHRFKTLKKVTLRRLERVFVAILFVKRRKITKKDV